MPIQIGVVEALFRYPVKSMRGEPLDAVHLGFHGLEGDRRLAFRREGDRGGFPWLTASKLPEIVLFTPVRRGAGEGGSLPTHVRTPEGEELPLFSQELAMEVSRRHGSPVEIAHLSRGVFDDASVSLITSTTIQEIGRLLGRPTDTRRYRTNILISSAFRVPFEEDDWVGGTLSFGDTGEAAALTITHQDVRCSMMNIDPDSGQTDAEVLKTIARARDSNAGVYAAVARRGRLAVGQPIFFEPSASARNKELGRQGQEG